LSIEPVEYKKQAALGERVHWGNPLSQRC
jgi:hypothetical protein